MSIHFSGRKGKSGIIPAVMAALLLALAGCDPGGAAGSAAKVYGGIEPQGDIVVVTVDGDLLTLDNQTLGISLGPIHFSRITDAAENQGFHNLYKTDPLDSSGQYLKFALLDGIGVVYQKCDAANASVGNPGCALFKKPFAIDDWKPAPGAAKLVNYIEFISPVQWGGVCCFGNGWITDNGDGTGLISGAKYDIRTAVSHGYGTDPATSQPYGVRNPFTWPSPTDTVSTVNWSEVNGHIDPAAGTYGAYNADNQWETWIATPGGALIGDYGLNNGGCFMIPQAETVDFKPAYAGTYLVFGFDLNDAGSNKNMKAYKVVLSDPNDGSGDGLIAVNELGHAAPPSSSVISPFADLAPHAGPGGVDLLAAFQAVSGSAAAPAPAKDAYRSAGSFILNTGTGVVFISIDPLGNYLYYMNIDCSHAPSLTFNYGFGVKDPNY
jgi:hypothetical protein